MPAAALTNMAGALLSVIVRLSVGAMMGQASSASAGFGAQIQTG